MFFSDTFEHIQKFHHKNKIANLLLSFISLTIVNAKLAVKQLAWDKVWCLMAGYFFSQVSLATGLGALLHYVKLVGNTTIADIMFIVITGVSSLFTLILFLTLLFNLQQKITRSTKNWNIFVSNDSRTISFHHHHHHHHHYWQRQPESIKTVLRLW